MLFENYCSLFVTIAWFSTTLLLKVLVKNLYHPSWISYKLKMKSRKEKLRDKIRIEINNFDRTEFSALVLTNYQRWLWNENENTQGKNLNNDARLYRILYCTQEYKWSMLTLEFQDWEKYKLNIKKNCQDWGTSQSWLLYILD